MDHLKVKQSRGEVSYCGSSFRLCGLEPYLDLAGDRRTIRHAVFHSGRRRVDILLMEQTFCSVYHSNTLPATRGAAPDLAYG